VLSTSDFVDDVLFSYNVPYDVVKLQQQLLYISRTAGGPTPLPPSLQRCLTAVSWHSTTPTRIPTPTPTPSRRQAPRLDESFMQEVPGRNMRRTIALL